MIEQGDLEGRNVLLLGDNDLTSIGVALTKKASSIYVIDIDKDVLNFIKLVSQKEGLKINCLTYNARNPLPSKLKGQFNVVFTDPPYTPEGFSLFISRAIEALKQKNTSVVYFCYGHSRRSNERELEIQKLLVKAGLLIKLIRPQFNQYLGAESIGSRSSIYIAEITPLAKPLIKGKFARSIYTGYTGKK